MTEIFFSMKTKILPITDESIEKAKEILLSGGLVGIPTETVYGLGANGLNSNAVKEIFSVKGRPSDNPLIAHVHKNYDLSKICVIEQDYVYKLQKAFLPGPLTMVYKSNGAVCAEALANGDTVAVRIPSHKGCQQLLESVNLPIVAPSANVSKHVSPVTAEHVYNDLNGKISLILDGGKSQGGIESTVLDVTGKVPRILRAGLITYEMIKEVVGACEYAEHKETDKVKSPGVKYSHYKPKCQTARFDKKDIDKAINLYEEYISQGKTPYFICEESIAKLLNGKNVLSLGKTPNEVASNLYLKLREGEEIADVLIAVTERKTGGVYDGIFNRLDKAFYE